MVAAKRSVAEPLRATERACWSGYWQSPQLHQSLFWTADGLDLRVRICVYGELMVDCEVAYSMTMQAALIGFLIGKGFANFTPQENVIIQTVAGATGAFPLVAGFVGIVPALGMLVPEIDGQLPLKLSWIQGVQWSLSIAFFG